LTSGSASLCWRSLKGVTRMNKTELKRFRADLEEKRDAVIRRARETMDQDMTLDAS